jgi:hypothetical protein
MRPLTFALLGRIAILSIFPFAPIISGQDSGSNAGPMLGLMFDRPIKGIRPIWGIPGSAFYGAPLNLGFDVARAAIAQNVAIVASTDGAVFFAQLKDGVVSTQAINAPPSPDAIAISSSGAFAALYYHDQASITVLTLGAAPSVQNSIPAPDAISALAISDDGKALAYAQNTDSNSNLISLDAVAGTPRNVAQAVHIVAAAFLPGSEDLVFADDAGGAVVLVRGLLDTATATSLLSGDQRMLAPGAVQPSVNGTQIVVAGPKDGSIAILDLGGGDPVFLNCNCAPGNLAGLSSKILYVLTGFQDGVVWLLDSSNPPRVLFVPPENDSASGPQQ